MALNLDSSLALEGEAIHSKKSGLPRSYAPRNDDLKSLRSDALFGVFDAHGVISVARGEIDVRLEPRVALLSDLTIYKPSKN